MLGNGSIVSLLRLSKFNSNLIFFESNLNNPLVYQEQRMENSRLKAFKRK
jgi:hypothetical protein